MRPAAWLIGSTSAIVSGYVFGRMVREPLNSLTRVRLVRISCGSRTEVWVSVGSKLILVSLTRPSFAFVQGESVESVKRQQHPSSL